MTGQTVALVVLAAAVVAALPWLLLRDLARAADRKLGGYFIDVRTGTVTRSPFIPHGTVYAFTSPPRITPPIRLPKPDPLRQEFIYRAEEHAAMSLIRPEAFCVVTGI